MFLHCKENTIAGCIRMLTQEIHGLSQNSDVFFKIWKNEDMSSRAANSFSLEYLSLLHILVELIVVMCHD